MLLAVEVRQRAVQGLLGYVAVHRGRTCGVGALPRAPWCDLDAFYADAISALWELTTNWSGTHRPYAAGDLLSAVRTRLRTLQATERRHRCRQTSTPDPLDTLPASIGRTGEELLAAAIVDATGHGLTIADAAFDVLAGLEAPDGRLVPYEELAGRAMVLRGDGFVIRAASLEDIIRAKERADRAKDRDALPELRALRDARAGGDGPLS